MYTPCEKKAVTKEETKGKNNLMYKTKFLVFYGNLIKIQYWKGYTHLVAIERPKSQARLLTLI